VFNLVSADEMRAAQLLTGARMAAWLACGAIPGVRPYAAKIRAGVLAAYLLGCAGYIGYVLFR
jgi:hypothetical protein